VRTYWKMCCQSQLHLQAVALLSKTCSMFRLFHKATVRRRHKNVRENEHSVLQRALLSKQMTPQFFFVALRHNAFQFTNFLDHTQRRTTVGRTPLGEGSARRRDLYLTTHNTHNRQTVMPLAGFEPTIPAGERTGTYALDRAATGSGVPQSYIYYYKSKVE